MKNSFSRRQFLQSGVAAAILGKLGVSNAAMGAETTATAQNTSASAVAGGAAAPISSALPTRVLGKTGQVVPLLGIGTATAGVLFSVEQGAAFFQKALDMGITYFDSAPESGGYGKAQLQLGQAFKDRRKDVFLTTKCARARADEALKMLEQNLKEMQTDHTDLVYVHSLGGDDMDFNVVTGPGGVMEFLEKAKREGLARFVGVSGHNRPDRFLSIIRDYDVDVIMNAVNFVDRNTYNFEEKVWPEAAKKNIALVAMKIFGGTWGSKEQKSKMPVDHHHQALRYALGLPNLSCMVLGMKTEEEIRRNIEWVNQYKPLTGEEVAALDALGKSMAGQWKDHLGKVV